VASPSTDRRFGLNSSVALKAPCDVATTANITLSGEQTIDGVTTSASRVLVKDQTTSTQNGIYRSDSGDWIRESDFNGNRDVVTGTLVTVTAGTVNANTIWKVSTTGTITIGTSNLTFVAYVLATTGLSLTAGPGITLVNNGGVYTISYDYTTSNAFTTNVYSTPTTLVSTVISTVNHFAVDATTSNTFNIALTANATLDNPTNLAAGMVLNFLVTQDVVGGWVLSYGSKFRSRNGTGFSSIVTTANAKTLISCAYDAVNDILICAMVENAS
jgi:hypothetical protein